MDNPRNPTFIKTRVKKTYHGNITYRNNFTRIKRKQREIYYGNLFQQYKSDIKKTWSTLNEILNRKNDKTSISDSFKIDNTIENDPTYIADNFKFSLRLDLNILLIYHRPAQIIKPTCRHVRKQHLYIFVLLTAKK